MKSSVETSQNFHLHMSDFSNRREIDVKSEFQNVIN